MTQDDAPANHVPSKASAVIAGIIVVLIVAVMTQLGFWQLRRHAEVRGQNAAIVERASRPLLLRDVDLADPHAVDFQRITARGVFRADEEVLWRGRGRNGVTGFEVLTPLDLIGDDDQPTGEVLLVNRGWVGPDLDEPPVTTGPPPAGIVEVDGILRPTIPQPGFGPKDPVDGELTHVFHADLDRLDPQIEGDLVRMYLRLSSTNPAMATDVVRPLSPTEPDAGPHLGYAFQWFAFSITAVVAYLAWLRRRSAVVG